MPQSSGSLPFLPLSLSRAIYPFLSLTRWSRPPTCLPAPLPCLPTPCECCPTSSQEHAFRLPLLCLCGLCLIFPPSPPHSALSTSVLSSLICSLLPSSPCVPFCSPHPSPVLSFPFLSSVLIPCPRPHCLPHFPPLSP